MSVPKHGKLRTASIPPSDGGSRVGTQPLKAGYLTKQGEVRKTWRKRWFQLESHGGLCYYKDAAHVAGKPLGVITVAGCDVREQPPAILGRSFAFSIIPKVEGERVYNIFADSANDLKEWMEVLLHAAAAEPAARNSGSANEVAATPTVTTMNSTRKMKEKDERLERMYSSSLPVQILTGEKASGKQVLAERRQQRQRMASVKEGLDSDDSDFEDEEEEGAEVSVEATETGTRNDMFRMSVVLNDAMQLLLHADNSRCGDCNAPGPEFISLPLGMAFCGKCAEVHATLPKDITDVRSAANDDFTEEELSKVRETGNRKGNEYWEAYVDQDLNRLKLQMNSQLRTNFIKRKYLAKAFTSPGKERENDSVSESEEEKETYTVAQVRDLRIQIEQLQKEVSKRNEEIAQLRADREAAKVQARMKRSPGDSDGVEQAALIEERKIRVNAEKQIEELQKQMQLKEETFTREYEEMYQKYEAERMRRREITQHTKALYLNAKKFQEGLARLSSHMTMLEDSDDETVGPSMMGYSFEGKRNNMPSSSSSSQMSGVASMSSFVLDASLPPTHNARSSGNVSRSFVSGSTKDADALFEKIPVQRD